MQHSLNSKASSSIFKKLSWGNMKFHRKLSIVWCFNALFFITPAVLHGGKADIHTLLGSILIVAACILMIPQALNWKWFRISFYWPDAMTELQIQALQDRNLRQFYTEGLKSDYISSLYPYLSRVSALLATITFGAMTGYPLIDYSLLFIAINGVYYVIFGILSYPWKLILIILNIE